MARQPELANPLCTMPLSRHRFLERAAAGGIAALLLKSARLGGAFWGGCENPAVSVCLLSLLLAGFLTSKWLLLVATSQEQGGHA